LPVQMEAPIQKAARHVKKRPAEPPVAQLQAAPKAVRV